MLSVTLTGVPNWVEQGPGPITNGQTEGLMPHLIRGDEKDFHLLSPGRRLHHRLALYHRQPAEAAYFFEGA